MHLSHRTSLALLATLLVSLIGSASALAAPITVNLRVEGSATTLFEGPISTQGETFQTTSSKGLHPCNYAENGRAGGKFVNEGSISGTPTTALRDAALGTSLAFNALWFGSGKEENENPGDYFVTQVGTDINQSAPPFASWGYAVNYTTAPVGGCQIALAPGNEVLWAYNYNNLSHLLRLTGPASVRLGAPLTVHVFDGQNGAPISGAAIGEEVAGLTTPIAGVSTDASGNATVTVTHAGQVALKVTRADSVRSNGLNVCVHNGNDGSCGETPEACPAGSGGCGGLPVPPKAGSPPPSVTTADTALAAGVASGRTYGHGRGPRLLAGVVRVPAGGTLREVRIGLERRVGRHCFLFSGARGAFVRARCGAFRFFSVGSSESFSYLLPARLPRGRYIYEVQSVDASGHVSALVSGVSKVAFRVA